MKTYSTDALPNSLTAFLQDYSRLYRAALVNAVNQRLTGEKDKAKLNTYLQNTHGINKRHANAVITQADGMIGSAKECRTRHIQQLNGKLKSAQDWLKKSDKRLKNARKFYSKKNWIYSKTGCQFPLSSSFESKRTNWQSLRFRIHHKKRYIVHLERKIEALKVAPIRVSVSSSPEIYFVGSKDETLGNQVSQFDGNILKIRVPVWLESKYGKYVQCQINSFPYGQEQIEQAVTQNQLGNGLAVTYRFYAKAFHWFMAVSFSLPAPKLLTCSRHWGCIGVDLNAKSVDWSYVDSDGNLKAHGKFPLHLSGKRKGQTKAIIADVVSQLTVLAQTYQCPIVCESLDFNRKKESLRERGRKYARMLSNFVYSRFLETLVLRCANKGIELIQVNPAYSSLIGLVKYSRMHGLSSGAAAAMVIARRAMRLSERLPGSLPALLGVNPSKHIWSQWNKLNNQLREVKRHCYYSIPNWESVVKLDGELDSSNRSSGKQLLQYR